MSTAPARPLLFPGLRALALLALGVLAACSGGGGSGSGSFEREAVLLDVRFPDPHGVNPGGEGVPPTEAPLVQQVVFEFSGSPDPDQVSRQTVLVQDESGVPVEGHYDVDGTVVTFTPRLPLRQAVLLGEDEWDSGGAGLDPQRRYSVRVGAATWSFVSGIAAELAQTFPDPVDPRGVLLSFETTGDPDQFFRGLEDREPSLLRTLPADGATAVTPQLYTDPGQLFAPRAPFRLHYDAPIHPAPSNLDFLLVDLDDPDHPSGLSLGVDVRLIENTVDGAVVEVVPSGILPFGHLLSLEAPDELTGLGGVPGGATTPRVVANFSTAPASDSVDDHLSEDFATTDRQDPDPAQLDLGELPAEWNRQGSHVLQASFAFDGAGELGRFLPAPPPDGERRTIILDTSTQVFPLLDGSTPDAPPGYVVRGGVFHFTEIVIPKGVDVEVRGTQPLVLTATLQVQIGGKFLLNGSPGTPDNSYDSAVTSIPGGNAGPGGGRGGEAHPILHWPPDQISIFTLVSPPSGGNGFGPGNQKRIGGGGGDSGIRDDPDRGRYGTDQEIDCNEVSGGNNNDSYGAGGSGGSFLTRGGRGRNGAGNVRADSQGGWEITRKVDDPIDWDRLNPGRRGLIPFSDSDPDNDFIGLTGELQELIGGQGGGGGGSRSEAYYCGEWCKIDADPTNDAGCKGGEFGNPSKFAASVGDARGGSGGGGAGSMMIQALGPITMTRNCKIVARGGAGAGGETLGRSNWGGPSGGGSGGALVFQSADRIFVHAKANLDVSSFGNGGDGIVQFQVPVGSVADVRDPDASITPRSSWVDDLNLRNPARFTSFSAGVSAWFDMGRTVDRPPADTNPVYEFFGLDDQGFVRTDEEGNVLEPDRVDVRCDYLGQRDPLRPGNYKDGQEPRSNFIPPNARVRILFQGARAIAEGSKEVAEGTVTAWSPDVSTVNSMQFLRYRVVFDIAADSSELSADAPRPAVQSLRVRARF